MASPAEEAGAELRREALAEGAWRARERELQQRVKLLEGIVRGAAHLPAPGSAGVRAAEDANLSGTYILSDLSGAYILREADNGKRECVYATLNQGLLTEDGKADEKVGQVFQTSLPRARKVDQVSQIAAERQQYSFKYRVEPHGRIATDQNGLTGLAVEQGPAYIITWSSGVVFTQVMIFKEQFEEKPIGLRGEPCDTGFYVDPSRRYIQANKDADEKQRCFKWRREHPWTMFFSGDHAAITRSLQPVDSRREACQGAILDPMMDPRRAAELAKKRADHRRRCQQWEREHPITMFFAGMGR